MAPPPASSASSSHRDGWGVWLVVLLVAIGLTMLFWGQLWQPDGTLIGGDTFSYYFPQKTFLSDSLKRGELPIWNPLVGAGYPIVAESQTGVLYPPTLVFYRFLSTNVAYSVNQLFHYVLAFAGMWAVSRRYRVSRSGSVLAALVYVYGWFATRICLEWAIIGGAYLPWCVWLVEGWLITRSRRMLLWLAPVFGLFLVAGHFHLAFITTLALAIYVPLRVFLVSHPGSTTADALPWRVEASQTLPGTRWQVLAWFAGILVAGYLFASVQLVPSLELMTRSQRQAFDQGNDPGYGHIPPWYLSQVFSSWIWYPPGADPDQELFQIGEFAYPSSTNKVEAHLYFGMLPILLILGVIGRQLMVFRRPFPMVLLLWLIVGGVGLCLAVGWPFVVLKHVPGFGYFRGAGRYSILTAFAASLLIGATSDDCWTATHSDVRPNAARTRLKWLIWLLAVGFTTWELYSVSRWVTYAVMLNERTLDYREESEIRSALATYSRPVRLWSPGSNAATILGVSAYPVYLGLGPREYFDPQLASNFRDEDISDPLAVTRQVDWLRRNGVTHILSFDPLNESQWSVRPVHVGSDQLLSRAWARYDSLLYLYECLDAPGRVVDQAGQVVAVDDFQQTANRVSMMVAPTSDSRIIVRELAYPGWSVTIDGQPAEAQVADGMYRAVQVPAGRHRVEWTYHPRSLWLGLTVSGVTALLWLVIYVRSKPVSNLNRPTVEIAD